MNLKRDRTESPNYSSTKRSKSETPSVASESSKSNTRGVETVPLGSNEDPTIVGGRLITNLAQQVIKPNPAGPEADSAEIKGTKTLSLIGYSTTITANAFLLAYLKRGSGKSQSEKPDLSEYLNNQTSGSLSAHSITGVGSFEDPCVLSGDEELITPYSMRSHTPTNAGTSSIIDLSSNPSTPTHTNNPTIPEPQNENSLADTTNPDGISEHDGERASSDSDTDISSQEDDGDEEPLIRPHLASPGPDLRLPLANEGQPPARDYIGLTTSSKTATSSRVPRPVQLKKARVAVNTGKPTSKPIDNPEQIASVVNVGVPRPREQGKSRRIVSNTNLHIWTTVSMGGDVQFIQANGSSRHRLHHCSMPGDQAYHVEDLCLVGDLVVIGYGRQDPQVNHPSEQVRMFSFENITENRPPIWVSVGHRPHERRGVKSLTAVDETSFLSGGYDGRVHLWTLRPIRKPVPTEIGVFFRHGVHALSCIPQTKTVMGGHKNYIKVFDLGKPVDSKGYQIARGVNHIHSGVDHPDVVALEVNDVDEQINVFDLRVGLHTRPSMRFGYREESNRKSDRYTRGAMQQCYFARGYNDGTVMLWDFRNSNAVLEKLRTCRTRSVEDTERLPVVHTMFSSATDLVVFGENVVSVFEGVV